MTSYLADAEGAKDYGEHGRKEVLVLKRTIIHEDGPD